MEKASRERAVPGTGVPVSASTLINKAPLQTTGTEADCLPNVLCYNTYVEDTFTSQSKTEVTQFYSLLF